MLYTWQIIGKTLEIHGFSRVSLVFFVIPDRISIHFDHFRIDLKPQGPLMDVDISISSTPNCPLVPSLNRLPNLADLKELS